ncbi:MAG: hypothetical protein H6Q15_1902 [Bacteroidetes bacterium]|nr:hypothetical protein [Bacteroidota bacterium]
MKNIILFAATLLLTIQVFSQDTLDYVELKKEIPKNTIKFNFLSPLMGHNYLSYERATKPEISWEAGIGIIGMGFDFFNIDARGALIRGGYRFHRSSGKNGVNPKNSKTSNFFNGTYIMPEVIISCFNYNDRFDKNSFIRRTSASCALMITLGKEISYSEYFALEYFASLGYGFSNKYNNDGLNYEYLGGDSDIFPIVISAGFKLGFIFYDRK